MKRGDILLVDPPMVTVGATSWFSPEPLNLGYLASALMQEGLKMGITNAFWRGWDVERTVAEIQLWDVPVIGITVMSPSVVDAVSQIVIRLRSCGVRAHITLGGNFATLAARELLEKIARIDSIVLGEGEKTLPELVRHVRQKTDWTILDGLAYRDGGAVRINRPRNRVINLDALPRPYRQLVPEMVAANIAPSILSSRGCSGNCCFCSVYAFQKLYPGGAFWRGRSPEDVVNEMEDLYTEYGAHRFFFVDDTFIGPSPEGRGRAWRIADEIIARNLPVKFSLECRTDDVDIDLFAKLKSAGLSLVCVGVESGCQRMLDYLGKHVTVQINRQALHILEELKIPTYADFIFVDPFTTLLEVKENLSFLREFARTTLYNIISFLEPRAGTDFTQSLRERGELLGAFERYQYRFKDSLVEKLYRIIDDHFGELYYQTGRLMRLCWELEGIDDGPKTLEEYLSLPGGSHSMVEQLIYMQNMFTIRCTEKAVSFLSNPQEPGQEAVEEFGKSLQTEIDEFAEGFDSQMALIQMWVSSLVSEDGHRPPVVWPSPGVKL